MAVSVAGSERHTLLRRVGRWVKRDFAGVAAAMRTLKPPQAGLHTYPFVDRSGYERRLHLRVEPGGAGLLFLDVTWIYRLNETAVTIVRALLEGQSAAQIRRALSREYRLGRDRRVDRDLEHLERLIRTLTDPDTPCPGCALEEFETFRPFAGEPAAPFKADLALDYSCDLRCAHCYNEPGRRAMPSLTVGQWRRVIDRLKTIGVPHLIFTGGEPTLHPHLPELIRHADAHGLVAGVNSNGQSLADPDKMQALAEAGLNHLQVTLNSSRAEVHDRISGAASFDSTVRGIRNALATRVHTITNTTLTRLNAGHALEIVDFIHGLGIRTFAMNGMISSGCGADYPHALPVDVLEPLLVSVRDHAADRGMRFLWYTPTEYCRLSPLELELGARRCNAAEYSVCIEPNGDVLPCQSYYRPAGNILRDRWSEIWNSRLFLSFRRRVRDPAGCRLPERCHNCPDLEICGGGCRLERERGDAEPKRRATTPCPQANHSNA